MWGLESSRHRRSDDGGVWRRDLMDRAMTFLQKRNDPIPDDSCTTTLTVAQTTTNDQRSNVVIRKNEVTPNLTVTLMTTLTLHKPSSRFKGSPPIHRQANPSQTRTKSSAPLRRSCHALGRGYPGLDRLVFSSAKSRECRPTTRRKRLMTKNQQ